jgi:membrane-associated protease RseP (regulator of RpoE activity)
MQSHYALHQQEADPVQEIANALQREMAGLFQVQSIKAQQDKSISFSGRLLSDAESAYGQIRERFDSHGYTPMLRRQDSQDVVVAVKGIIGNSGKSKPTVNIILFLATVLTTLAAGASMAGDDLIGAIFSGSISAVVTSLLSGMPFAITLLGILGVHELGHYMASRLHGVRATLPYFIPLPAVGIGTLGAFIQMKSPMTDRKVLFDIGMAGPYAGLLVAIPTLFLGLYLSIDNVVPIFVRGITLSNMGSSIFITGLVQLFGDVPAGYTLRMDPIFFAAWLGFLLTALNLLPAGQLDGGHAAYAVLGRWAHTLAYVVVFALIIIGAIQLATQNSMQWFIWAFFILVSGLRHPPPMNDITDVGITRKAIGGFSLLLFILFFPFSIA